jgi:hypothetical protein
MLRVPPDDVLVAISTGPYKFVQGLKATGARKSRESA